MNLGWEGARRLDGGVFLCCLMCCCSLQLSLSILWLHVLTSSEEYDKALSALV